MSDPLPRIPDRDAGPRRLHPATMVVAIVRGAPSTLLGLPALLAFVARAELWLVVAGGAAAFAVAGLLRWLAWFRFTYALGDDAVMIESGILGRNRRTIPYDRIADVGIERRPLQRVFGLASVTLETGGAGADEGTLDSVALGEAERLRETIRRRRNVGADPVPSESGIAGLIQSRTLPIFAMDARRVLLWGLFNFSLVWIAVAFGALQYLDRTLGFDADIVWDAVTARTERARSLPPLSLAGIAVAGTAVILTIGMVAGVVRTSLRDHGFALFDEGDRLRRVRGLFTRSEAVVSLPRVQLITIDSGPIRRAFGWSRLRAQVLGGEDAGGRQDLAPFAQAREIDAILPRLRLTRVDAGDMTSVARGHIWRALLRRAVLPMLLIAAASIVTPFALLASPLLVLFVIEALLARRHHRYHTDAGVLHVQRGVIGRTTWIMPTRRAQVLTLRRSWVQRRLGLATVLVDTAGGGRFDGPHVHDVGESDGWALLDRLRSAAGTRPHPSPSPDPSSALHQEQPS